jgi:hypothetical protein
MKKPTLWLSTPGSYHYRVDFRFIDASGKLLKTRTWELKKQPHAESKIYLLQASAKLVSGKPVLEELGMNFVALTVVVAELEGELRTTSLAADRGDLVYQQMAAFPLSFGVLLSHEGLKFSLYTAKAKNK